VRAWTVVVGHGSVDCLCAWWCCLALLFHHHHVWAWLKLCGHRHTAVPSDINEQNVMREGGCGCFEVVVDVEGFAATTS